MKMMSAGLLALAIGAVPCTTFAQEDQITDRQGVWYGGFVRQSWQELKLELKVIRDVGIVEVQFHTWEPVGQATCQYVFDATVEHAIELQLNGSYGSPDQCEQQVTMTFERTSADRATVMFEGWEVLPEFEVAASLRPLRDQDRRSPVSGLDILGVQPGMPVSAAEALLINAGFQALPAWTRVSRGRSGDWTQETRSYVRQEQGSGNWGDVFTIQFSAVVASEPTEQRAALISRDWDIPEDQGLSQLSLMNALSQKYGEPLPNAEDRFWDRSGQNLTSYEQRRANCATGPVQEIPYRIDFQRTAISSSTTIYCGPVASVYMRNHSGGGLASELNIMIVDPDEVWDSFWRSWSDGEYPAMRALLDNVLGATGAAPDL